MQEPGLMALNIDPNIHLSVVIAQHLPAIVLCIAATFMVRRQIGGSWIVLGVGLLLLRELFYLLAHQDGVYTLLDRIGTNLIFTLLFGMLILGFGFIGIGLMQPHQNSQKEKPLTSRWLNAALFTSITIELCILVNRESMSNNGALVNSVQDAFHLLSLALLVAVVVFRQINHSKLSLEAASSQRQLDAMISMFSAVKHDLNNDMQVVVGSAELAETLINSGGNVQKTVSNISDAANTAIERIEQLSVFHATAKPIVSAIDLNSTLRESMARLVNEIPAIVTMKLDLEHLPIRVMADRYLLSLSLTNMLRKAIENMQHGGEIVIRTQDLSALRNKPGSAVVNVEVFIVRALGLPLSGSEKSTSRGRLAKNGKAELEGEFATTQSLLERSGAVSVAYSTSSDEFVFSMGFVSDAAADKIPVKITLGQSLV